MYLVKFTKHSDQLQVNTSHVLVVWIQFAKFVNGPNIQNILFPRKADENGEKNEFSVNDELTFDG